MAQDKAAPAAQDQGQSIDSYIEMVRADTRADKVAIITEAMKFSDQDAKLFWPVYRKYEAEQMKVNDQRVAAIKKYADKFDTMTDADAKDVMDQTINYAIQRAELKRKYAKEFLKAGLPALTVAKFLQLEHRLDLLIDLRLAAALPPLLDKH
jgi:phage-related minor tail protein